MTFLSKKPLLFFIIILVETLAVLASPVLPSPEGNNDSMVNITQMFEEWIVENGRVYSDSSEKARRFEIFKATFQRMEEKNKRSGRPNRYYLHPFADFYPNESRSCVDMEMEMWFEEGELKRYKTSPFSSSAVSHMQPPEISCSLSWVVWMVDDTRKTWDNITDNTSKMIASPAMTSPQHSPTLLKNVKPISILYMDAWRLKLDSVCD